MVIGHWPLEDRFKKIGHMGEGMGGAQWANFKGQVEIIIVLVWTINFISM